VSPAARPTARAERDPAADSTRFSMLELFTDLAAGTVSDRL
jgi:hypothetical protein